MGKLGSGQIGKQPQGVVNETWCSKFFFRKNLLYYM